MKHNGAAIAICGEVDDDDSAWSCNDITGFANQIQQTCMNGPPDDPDSRAGGTYTISASQRVEVIGN